MVSLVGNSVTRQVWGNFMSDAKNLTGNSLLPKENIYCNQKGKFHVRFLNFDRKFPYFVKKIYIAINGRNFMSSLGKFHVRFHNFDKKFPYFVKKIDIAMKGRNFMSDGFPVW